MILFNLGIPSKQKRMNTFKFPPMRLILTEKKDMKGENYIKSVKK